MNNLLQWLLHPCVCVSSRLGFRICFCGCFVRLGPRWMVLGHTDSGAICSARPLPHSPQSFPLRGLHIRMVLKLDALGQSSDLGGTLGLVRGCIVFVAACCWCCSSVRLGPCSAWSVCWVGLSCCSAQPVTSICWSWEDRLVGAFPCGILHVSGGSLVILIGQITDLATAGGIVPVCLVFWVRSAAAAAAPIWW